MIDLIDKSRKVIFRFTTDDQAAVEYFCLSIGHHYGVGGAYFSESEKTKVPRGYQITMVKATVTRKSYKFEMGPHLQDTNLTKKEMKEIDRMALIARVFT